MRDSLVDRLRAEDPETGLRHSIASEAADRIEQLENYLRLIAEHPVDKSEQWETGCKEMRKVARLALGEKKDGE